ncbi:hypothetical protein BCS96_15230 [Vibrio breoganii]|uniref:Uncharacterized protein n=1 Tax=Vibrio breoganii TaxID=553239 RepID=A0AAP8MVC9_9VIBR|nr:hypothetical protein [Vibrio breoganii]NMR69847.1 hypothetical protein [Vibrio breoganii]PMF99678.1 hypothetical protein BCV02_02925 [Vibrio breoganii]PMG06341.1 hypothetical protein BCV00_10565 [Vibrio breoganii]PMG32455.1 hypothetical protein BCU93_05885 [Vibrio breoganii]
MLMRYEIGFTFVLKQGIGILLAVLLIVSAFFYLSYDLNQTILAFGDVNELIDETPITVLVGEYSSAN